MPVIRVCLQYDDSLESFWSSREQMMRQFYELGGKSIKWSNGKTTPGNWLGYSDANPSPGVNLSFHFFYVETKEEAMIIALMGGRIVGEVNK